ncbi:hypothetical protein EL26_05585 [Tumebacillus flagellatus]|uniref:Uncharacterized protein n=2 Tax=Tumebacillus flagellatus TaxID=1157490 RepID=A0A074MEL6_9BACL|nr:hypothetical protein EL26_05585 [Tumebacillus flagellatus]
MNFDTFLKLTKHAASILQHDSFHEMSRMIHRGVKRRLGDPPRPNGQTPTLPPQQPQPKKLQDYLTPENYNAVRQVVKTLASFHNKSKQ